MARIPFHPSHPERICWGCDKYCPADDMACGNGTIRTVHPAELFGPDWDDWAESGAAPSLAPSPAAHLPRATGARASSDSAPTSSNSAIIPIRR